MKRLVILMCLSIGMATSMTRAADSGTTINYSLKDGDLQRVIDAAPSGATILCNSKEQLELAVPLSITKPLTFSGLNARLPEKLGNTSLILVSAEGVTLIDLELHGNYDSVDQSDRTALLRIRKGNFRVERCKFYDGSKDGVNVSPVYGSEDLVGGVIKDIKAWRMGRDAVSISGGNAGLKVRDVTIEDVRLEKGYFRGAVEVSDGTDNIVVKRVYAIDCLYAVDVQDHKGKKCAPNTNIVIEDVTAVRCKHIVRSGTSERGHVGLILRNLTGKDCSHPLRLRNTRNVTINGLKILNHQSNTLPPVSIDNCQDVQISNAVIESIHFSDQPIVATKSENVMFAGKKLQ